MGSNQSFLPKPFYDNYLTSIKSVKFTERETGVISCLLSGRSPKKISSLLAISLRTVETHIRNIMTKIDAHSREELMDFVESSPERNILKIYYDILVKYNNFSKIVLSCSSQDVKQAFFICIDCELSASQNFFFKEIITHLNLIGIKASLKFYKDWSALPHFYKTPSSKKENIFFYFFSIEEEKKSKDYLSCNTINNANTYLMFFSDAVINELKFSENKKHRCVIFNQNDYYVSLCTLLKKILPGENLNLLFKEFNGASEEEEVLAPLFPKVKPREHNRKKESFLVKVLNFLKEKYYYNIMITILLGIFF